MDINTVETKLEALLGDTQVPKSVRDTAQAILMILHGKGDKVLKITKSLERLDEIAEDPNIPTFIRTQIWNIASDLEACKR